MGLTASDFEGKTEVFVLPLFLGWDLGAVQGQTLLPAALSQPIGRKTLGLAFFPYPQFACRRHRDRGGADRGCTQTAAQLQALKIKPAVMFALVLL